MTGTATTSRPRRSATRSAVLCCIVLYCTVLYCIVLFKVCYSEEEDLSIKSFFDLFTLSSDNTGTGATEDYYGHYGS